MKIIIKNSNLVFEKFEQQYQTYSLNETDRWIAEGAELDYTAYMYFPQKEFPLDKIPSGSIITFRIYEKDGYQPSAGEVTFDICTKREKAASHFVTTGNTCTLNGNEISFILDHDCYGFRGFTNIVSDKSYMRMNYIVTVKIPVVN